MNAESYIEMDFSGFTCAVRAYRLAKSIGMIGQHKVRRCTQCRMVVPALVSLWGNPYEHREYYFCDYEDRHPQVQHLFADEGEWFEDSITPLSCADGHFFASIDGGYPVLFISRDGDTFCNECASDPSVAKLDDNHVRICATDIFYEGPAVSCAHCSKLIESAYGDPDNPEED